MISNSSISNSHLQLNISDAPKIQNASKKAEKGFGVKYFRYACLADGCQKKFEEWHDARWHMVHVCHFDKKLNFSDSSEKAKRLNTPKPNYVDPTPENRFSDKLKTDHAPSEAELVDLVKEYYSKGDNTERHRRRVIHRAITPIYENFKFPIFGFRTFHDFSKFYDLDAYCRKNKSALNTTFQKQSKERSVHEGTPCNDEVDKLALKMVNKEDSGTNKSQLITQSHLEMVDFLKSDWERVKNDPNVTWHTDDETKLRLS